MRVEAIKKVAMALGHPPHREKTASTIDVGILAHEGGHSKVHNRLGGFYSRVVPVTAELGRVGGPTAALVLAHGSETPSHKMSKKEKAIRRRLAALTDVGLHVPRLADEAAASIIGLRDLKKGQIDPAAYKAIRRKLGYAFGTYAASPVGKAVAHGLNEYGAVSNGASVSPVVASILGSLGASPFRRLSGGLLSSSRGHRIDEDNLQDWVRKLKIKVPVSSRLGGGSSFLPGIETRKEIPYPAYSKGAIDIDVLD